MLAEAEKRGFPRPEFHEIAIGQGAELTPFNNPGGS
jgi:hypothetical protein